MINPEEFVSAPIDPERNREILAKRLHWPDGALKAVRELEARHQGYNVYYSRGEFHSQQGPGFYAKHGQASLSEPSLYAPTSDEMDTLIAADAKEREARSRSRWCW